MIGGVVINSSLKSVVPFVVALTCAGIGCIIVKRKGGSIGAVPDVKSSTSSKASQVLEDTVLETSGQTDAIVVDVANAVRINGLLKRLALIRNFLHLGTTSSIW